MTGFLTEREKNDRYTKALMIEPEVINDPYIRIRIYSMQKKKIELAKKGSIKVNANYAMISGDPYALCQSMFGMEVTGLLKSGELYHKYWIDKGSTELACFRAPMTCHNNIRKLKLNNTDEAAYWYRYITTAPILNAWDTTCDAMNGADKDGDAIMATDNPIILKHTKNSPTIMCVQRNAEKKVPTEDDIIQANKLAFNDDIGTVTNHVTSMINVQSGLDKGTSEYDTLSYRIMCGQFYQQNTIDRAKGIIAEPMPKEWYDRRISQVLDTDDGETVKRKKINQEIVADKKPYFMIYNYPELKKKFNDWRKSKETYSAMYYGFSYAELNADQKKEVDDKYDSACPVNMNQSIINRISWIFEKEFDGYLKKLKQENPFDYTIYKSDVEYENTTFKAVKKLWIEAVKRFNEQKKHTMTDESEDRKIALSNLVTYYKREFACTCTNEKELCNILLDVGYQQENTKQYVWDIVGNVIIKNLLEKHDYRISLPVKVDSGGEFEYMGQQFVMKTCTVPEDWDNEE